MTINKHSQSASIAGRRAFWISFYPTRGKTDEHCLHSIMKYEAFYGMRKKHKTHQYAALALSRSLKRAIVPNPANGLGLIRPRWYFVDVSG